MEIEEWVEKDVQLDGWGRFHHKNGAPQKIKVGPEG